MSAKAVAAARDWSTEVSGSPSSPHANLIGRHGSRATTLPWHFGGSRYHRPSSATTLGGGKVPTQVQKHDANLAHAQQDLQHQSPVSSAFGFAFLVPRWSRVGKCRGRPRGFRWGFYPVGRCVMLGDDDGRRVGKNLSQETCKDSLVQASASTVDDARSGVMDASRRHMTVTVCHGIASPASSPCAPVVRSSFSVDGSCLFPVLVVSFGDTFLVPNRLLCPCLYLLSLCPLESRIWLHQGPASIHDGG